MIDKKLLIIGGVVVVALVVVLVLVLKKKGTSSTEKFYPCTGCKSWGIKSCINRDLFKQMYRDGILTENTIDPSGQANWEGDQPLGDDFYQYQPEAGKKGCCGGWS